MMGHTARSDVAAARPTKHASTALTMAVAFGSGYMIYQFRPALRMLVISVKWGYFNSAAAEPTTPPARMTMIRQPRLGLYVQPVIVNFIMMTTSGRRSRADIGCARLAPASPAQYAQLRLAPLTVLSAPRPAAVRPLRFCMGMFAE